jgi:hypothetical protein
VSDRTDHDHLPRFGPGIYEQPPEAVNAQCANTAYWHTIAAPRYTPRMPFSPTPLPSSRVAAALLAALLWIGVAAVAGAATPDGASPGTANASTVEQWKGRFCTATSCRNAPASPLSAAASFGAAILAIRWMARRPASHPAAPDSSASSPPDTRSD